MVSPVANGLSQSLPGTNALQSAAPEPGRKAEEQREDKRQETKRAGTAAAESQAAEARNNGRAQEQAQVRVDVARDNARDNDIRQDNARDDIQATQERIGDTRKAGVRANQSRDDANQQSADRIAERRDLNSKPRGSNLDITV